ncbi:uncharacterized protein RCO7_02601 [Rhynchosporium graminicola]|uniref:Uncharacterized protein n=1 Tax=Rhynchosporium graminicola TaxID=2792576 RepID=A0A1E1KFL4_9HELO|nr:uncharacterized protein RCO7_02601 [Rhynchosporium commune]
MSSRIVRRIHSKRFISASTPPRERSEWRIEKFNVKCGSSGSITVDLHNSSALKNPSNTLIIHFPPSGTHLKHSHPSIPSYLINPKTALASINYRWNIPSASTSQISSELYSSPSYSYHAFPKPLHDTLAGYSFLLSILPRYSSAQSPSLQATPSPALSPSQTRTANPRARNSIYASSPTTSSPLPVQRPILLYGSFLGGTLATSLSLTETTSSRSNPTKIIGLIVKNGVYDWTDVATSPTPPLPPSTSPLPTPTQHNLNHKTQSPNLNGSWDLSTLHKARQSLFSSPASAFDPFASPTLFFRTSGLAIPRSWPTDEDPTGNSSRSTSSDPSPLEAEDIWPSEEDDLFQVTAEELHPNADIPRRASPSSEASSLSTSSLSRSSIAEVAEESEKDNLSRRMSQMFIEPPSRPSHLKYPPANSNLKIPFSLFLYTPSTATPLTRARPPIKPKSKLKANIKPITKPSSTTEDKWRSELEAQIDTPPTPQIQAENLASLLQRSVFYHEFAERKMWDNDLDVEGESERRAVARCLGSERSDDEEEGIANGEGEGEVVRRWIREVAG